MRFVDLYKERVARFACLANKNKKGFLFLLFILFLSTTSNAQQQFTAKSLGDYGNVTVMEATGNYDINSPDGSSNTAPRQAIAKEFFSTHKDEYDFLVVFTNFDFQMIASGDKGFYRGVKNDTHGIGQDLFDNTSLFGSSGRLQGMIDMGNLANVVTDLLNPEYEETLNTLSHELMHRWGVNAKFKNADGTQSTALLGDGGNHWSFLLDTGGSVMYGNRWQDNKNGTLTSTTPYKEMKVYSPLDLYLMGMIDKSKISPMMLIKNTAINPSRLPEAGVTISGAARTVTIDDIIAAIGPRTPEASTSQKNFKSAFIYITQPGTFVGDDVYKIENVRSGAVTRFSVLTDGGALMQVASTLKENVPSNPGVLPPSSTPRTLPPDINQGVTWLANNQKADGSWLDDAKTSGRDTAEATLVLKNFINTRLNYQNGIQWMDNVSSENVDFLARKVEALKGSGQDLTVLVNDILSCRNEDDGGWGSDKNYPTNPTDTAMALKSLSAAGLADQGIIAKAIGYLKSRQNTDGSWGSEDKGGMVQKTSTVLSAFNQYRMAYQLDDAISRGTAWLIGKQNADNGFGNSPSTVYDTAVATMTLRELNVPTDITNKALAYLLGRQSENGSWNNSAFQTALAVEAIYKGTVDPDLAVTTNDITIIPDKIRSLPSNIVINANIQNLGQTSAQAKVFLYEGSIADQNKIGELTIAFPGQSATTVTFSAMARDGNEHRFYIVVDPDNQVKESNELNNTAIKVLYPEATYDFEVLSSGVVVSANPVNMAQDVTMAAKITNKGTMNAYNVQVKYFIGDLAGAFEVATKTMDIPSNTTITDQITWRVNRAGVNMPLTVVVDPLENFTELSETNNKATIPLTVNADTRPNLTVSYKDLTVTPNPAKELGNSTISIVVKNEGFAPVNDAVVNFYRGVPGPDALLLGTRIIPALAAGESAAISVDWTGIPESGEKIIYVQVDPDNLVPEIREDDNGAFTTISILTLPDLAVSTNAIIFSPAAPKEGDPVAIAVTVQNKGEQAASNVVVRLSENGTVLGERTISTLAGTSTGTVSLSYDTAGKKGAHTITATVDPDNAISEQTRNNNSASRTLGVQDASLWVTEQYISPNGDGVKDSTDFFFRLQAPATVTVRVANRKNEVIRTFSGPELVNISEGSITWDGLSESGVAAADGEYQLQVLNTSSTVLGMLQVTVDTNRSPLTEALGTSRLLNSNLTCMLPNFYDEDWAWLPDESGIVLSLRGRYQQYDPGFYYISPAGDIQDIVRYMLSADDFADPSVWNLSNDGRIVFLSWKFNSVQNKYTERLWTVDADGTNLRLLMQFEQARFEDILAVKWSPDSKYISYNLGPIYNADGTISNQLWLLNVETSAKTRIEDKYPYDLSVEWSPDNSEIAYLIYPSGSAELKVSDISGNKKDIYTFNPQYWSTQVHWLHNNKMLIEYSGGLHELWLLDATGNGNHVKVAGEQQGEVLISPDKTAFTFFANLGLYISDSQGRTDLIHNVEDMGFYCTHAMDNVVWSADSKRILFSLHLGTDSYYCAPYNPQLITFDRLTRAKTAFDGSFSSMHPLRWLSDGASIISADYYTIYAMNALTGQASTLIPDIYYQTPFDKIFSPLQNYITYYKQADRTSTCYNTGSTDLWAASSLLNLTAQLQATKSKSAVILKGIAADLNFEGYQLDYADIKTPDIWTPVLPPSNIPVVNDTFAAWIPPYEGSFYVRLTIRDKAGNSAFNRKKISWGQASGITNLYKSLEVFSPNGDGVKDTVELHYRVLEPSHLEFTIYDEANRIVRTFYKDHAAPSIDFISWDGKDESQIVVPDGKYIIKIFDYEFFVEVDNKPSQVAAAFGNIYKDEKTGAISLDLKGYVIDRNLKTWVLEYGTGNNPQEWQMYKQGTMQIVRNDALGNPMVDPAEKITIEKFFENGVGFLVGKKLRMTAEDHAGNTSVSITDFVEETIIFDRYRRPEDFGGLGGIHIIPQSELQAVFVQLAGFGQHEAGGLTTIRKPLAGLNVQLGRFSQQLNGWEWIDSSPADNLAPGMFTAEWNNSGIVINGIRIKALDTEGREYFSNILKTANLLSVALCPLRGLNFHYESLQSLTVQVKSSNDVRYPDWTTLKIYTAPYVPVGSFDLPRDNPKPGMDYTYRIFGTSTSGSYYESPAVNESAQKCEPEVKDEFSGALSEGDYPEMECGIVPQTAKMMLNPENIKSAALLKTLSYVILKPEGPELLRAYDLSREGWGGVTIDTSKLREGSYTIKATVSYIDAVSNQATEFTAEKLLTVDRQLPTAQISYPTASARLCPVVTGDLTGDWRGIAVEGMANDNIRARKYALYFGIGQNPAEWQPAMTKKDGKSLRIQGTGPIQGQLGIWDITGITAETVSLKLEVVDWQGGKSCYTTSFSTKPQIAISGIAVDRAVFSPNNDGTSDNAVVTFGIDDYATVDVKVYKLLASPSGYVLDASPVRTIRSGMQHAGGTETVLWDGKDDGGVVVQDGRYAIVAFATDACGNYTAQRWSAVEVDNTPPSSVIAYPKPGDALAENIISVTGTVEDEHFQSYTLEAGQGNSPASWSQISSNNNPAANAILGRWNTYGLTGVWTLRLTAGDSAGNIRRISAAIDLSSRKNLVKWFDLAPNLFSPNNDAKLDATSIDYEITDTCDVKIEILDAAGVIRKIYSAPALAPGAHSYAWNGTDDANTTLANGSYNIRLMAALSSNPAVSQAEAATVIVDTTAPVIDITQPLNSSYLSAQNIVITGSITDVNMSGYSLTYTGLSGSTLIDQANQARTNYTFGALNSLPEGDYSLEAKAKDLAQNEAIRNIAFTIDRTPPMVKLETPKDGEYYGAEKNIIISGSMVEKNLESFSLRFGAGDSPVQWTDLVTGTTLTAYPQQYTWKVGKNDGVPDGRYTLSLFAKDKAGMQAEVRGRVVIDNTAPTAAITSLHDGDYVKQAVDVLGSALDQNLDKYIIDISEGQCGSAFKWASIKTGTTSVQDGTLAAWQALPPDGDYCAGLTAIDKVGQTAEAKVNVKVDTHPPAAPALSGNKKNKADAQLTWTGNTEPDIAGYNVYRSGQKINTALVSGNEFLDQNLAEGIHEYVVKAVDFAGWESLASNTVNLKIDLTGPTARIRSPQDGARISGALDIKGTVYSEDDFKQYRVYTGQGTSPASWSLVRTSPLPVSYGVLAQWDTLGLADGAYSIKLEAEDTSGNITSHQISVTIDNTAPERPVILSAGAIISNATVTWKANTDSDLAGYLLYRNDQLANVTGIVVGDLAAYLISPVITSYLDKALPDGTYRYYLIAVDHAGNMSTQSEYSIDVFIDTRAPLAGIVDPAKNSKFDGKILVRAESPDLDIESVQFQYQIASSPTWSNLGSHVTSPPFVTNLDPAALGLVYGDYHLQAVATDGKNQPVTAPGFITVTYADLTPPPAPAGLSSRTTGAEVSLAWTASTDADTVSYNVYRTSGGWRSRINPTPVPKQTASYADVGLYDEVFTYDITAVDAGNNESKPSNSVPAKVYAPLITQPSTPTAQQTISVRGSNAAPASTVEIFVQDSAGYGQRGTVSADQSGTFSFEVLLAPGQNRITAKATDADGNVSRTSASAFVVYDPAPAAPSGLAGSVTGSDVTLTWNQNPETDLAGYYVYRNSGQGWTRLTSVAIQSLRYTDFNLPNGTYSYNITAKDQIGSESPASNGVIVRLALTPPQPPVLLNIIAAPTGELNILWEHPGTGVAGYTVYRGTVSGGPYEKVAQVPVSKTVYTDTGLVNGKSYFYVVTAKDQAGNESAYSNEGSGIPADVAAPGKPRITVPTVPGSPITVFSARTDVSGMADLETSVELFRNGASAGTTTTKSGTVVTSFAVNPALGGASLSQDGSMLAYDSSGSIWLQNLAASTVSEIIPGGFSPLWSPAGDRIAYRFADGNGYPRIGIFERATGTTSQLTDDLWVYEYMSSWSADGSAIAFLSVRNGVRGIWIKNMQTGELTQAVQSDYLDEPRISPDEKKLAYFDYGSLYIKDLATGQTTLVDDYIGGYSIGWAPDSGSLAFISYRNGETRIYTVDIATGNQVPLAGASGNVYWPAWTSDGRTIVFSAWDDATSTDSLWSTPASGEGQAQLIEQGLPGLYYLTAIDNGGIAYINVDWAENGDPAAATLKIKSSGGTFEFKNIPLEQGQNIFAVRAVDHAGNTSALSDEISVLFDARELPELFVSSGDVYLYPAAPVAGERLSINAVISNAGGGDAADVKADIYVWNVHGQLKLLKSERIPLIAAGSVSLLTAEWDSTNMSGDNRIVIVVDADYRIDEPVESNNMAIRDFYVADRAGISLNATTDAAQYGSNRPVNIGVTVHNSGPANNFVLSVRIDDENGYPVAIFDPTALALAYASSSGRDILWNTGSTYAEAYSVHAVLKDAFGNILAENRTAFTITSDAAVDLAVVTDKIAYGPMENVTTSFTIKNTGMNAVIQSLQSAITISSATGTVLFSQVKTGASLLPGASVDLSSVWNTGLNIPGDYQATVVVSFDGGATVTRSAAFKINSVFILTGSVAASPAVVPIGSTAQLSYALTNAGNVDVRGHTARISILDPETTAIMQTADEVVDIAPNTSRSGQITVNTSGYQLKTYMAVLQIQSESVTKNLASASLAVKDLSPPVVTVTSPSLNGIYQSNVNISASVSDNASGIDIVEYQLDGGAWKLLPPADSSSGRHGTTWEAALSDNGPHIMSFRAADKSGNRSASVSVSFTIQMDTTPPSTTAAVGTPKYEAQGNVFIADTTVVTLSATDDMSGVALTEYRIDGGAWTAYAPFTIAGEGTHMIDYYSKDNLTNTEPFKTLTVIVDSTPPVTSVTAGNPKHSAPDAKLYVVSTTAFTLTAADNLSGVAATEYRIDNGQWTAYVSRFTVTTEGMYTIDYYSKDNLTNAEPFKAITVIVDNTPPVTSFTAGDHKYADADGKLYVTSASTFTLAATDNLSGVATTEYRIDNGAWTAYTPFTIAGEGTHTIDYYSKDNLSNTETLKFLTVIVDNTVPISAIAVDSPQHRSEGKLYISGETGITITATDAASGVANIEYSVDGGQWNLYSAFTLSSYIEDSHSIRYRSIDNVSNIEDSRELVVILDKTPPSTTISASDPLIDGVINTVSPSTFFTLSAADTLSGVRSIAYRVNNGEWQGYTGSFSLADRGAGQYTIAYKAMDNVLNHETEKTVTIRLIVIDVSKKISADPVVLIGAWRHDCEGHDEYEKKDHDSEKSIDKKLRGDNGNRHETDGEDDDNTHMQGALDKLTGILTTAGITHYVPTDEEDFVAAFRSGRFNTYILLDEKEDHLEDMEKEIREAVHYGQGLIYLKTRPDQDPKFDDLLGVKFYGRTTSQNVTITLLDSPISNEGVLENADKAVITAITTTTAQTYANMIDKHRTHPAIVYNQYGRGRTLLYAFDLLSLCDHARAAALLINSINQVRPGEQTSGALANLPIRIKLDNSTEPVDLRIKEYLPDSTTADSVTPASLVVDGTITWEKSLEAGEKGLFGYYLNVPDLAGSYRTRTEILYSNLGEYRPYGSYSLTLTVPIAGVDQLKSTIAGLDALHAGLQDTAPDHHDRKSEDRDVGHIVQAIRELSNIDAPASDRKTAGRNIERISKAIEEIRKLTLDTTEIRLRLDELLRIWETRWYLMGLPPKEEKHRR